MGERHDRVRAEITDRLGKNIKRLREAKGWSEQEFDAKLGWEGLFVIQLEEGNYNPRLWMIDRVAEVLECTEVDLARKIK